MHTMKKFILFFTSCQPSYGAFANFAFISRKEFFGEQFTGKCKEIQFKELLLAVKVE